MSDDLMGLIVSCTQTDIDDIITYLSAGVTDDIWNEMIARTTGGSSSLLNWSRYNEQYEFLYQAGLTYPGAISTYQDNPSNHIYAATGNGRWEYMNLVKEHFGQAVYDEIAAVFLSSSSLYTDSLNISEWHIYGSSRLGIQ